MMGRPKKPLLMRCRERSFRARHHWPLLITEPDLPCPSLAELQRRAREAQSEAAIREVARLFKDTLDNITPAEEQLLLPAQPDGTPDDAEEEDSAAAASAQRELNDAFLAAVHTTLADLPIRFRTELSAPDQIQSELIRRAAKRLAEIDQCLATDGLTVPGSQGQLRSHPLLSCEAGLRREITRELQQLEFRVRNRAFVDRFTPLARESRSSSSVSDRSDSARRCKTAERPPQDRP